MKVVQSPPIGLSHHVWAAIHCHSYHISLPFLLHFQHKWIQSNNASIPIARYFCRHKFLWMYKILVKTKFLQFIFLQISFLHSATPLTPLSWSIDRVPSDTCYVTNFCVQKFFANGSLFTKIAKIWVSLKFPAIRYKFSCACTQVHVCLSVCVYLCETVYMWI